MPNLPRITERHYAHICSEAYLAGAFELEGYYFDKTTAFFKDYVADHHDEIPVAGEQVYNALCNLDSLNLLIRQPDLPKDTLETVVYDKVMALKKGEFILFPGGWKGNPGHAMIYELRKTESGGLIVKIYNTGEGLTEHRQHLEKFDPIVSYEIPPIELEKLDFKTHFKILVKKLTKVSIADASIDYHVLDATQLYNDVIAKLAYLGAVEIPTIESEIRYTRGQLAGTCAQNSLHEMLKAQFASVDDYICFMYKFKAYALECYIATLKADGEFLNSAKKDLLIKGIKSNLRLLNRLKSDGNYVFDEQYKIQELRRLSEYLVALSAVPKDMELRIPTVLAIVKEVPDLTIISQNQFIHRDSPENLSISEMREHQKQPILSVPLTEINDGTSNIIADLDKIFDEITSLQSSGQFEEAIKRLESLVFAQLKLPKSIEEPLQPPYANLNTNKKAEAFLKQMSRLESLADSLYTNHRDSLQVYKLTGYFHEKSPAGPGVMQQHIRLHVMTLTSHVFSALPAYRRQPKEYRELLKLMLSSFPSKELMIRAFDMASNKPVVDTRYQAICALVSPAGMEKNKHDSNKDKLLELELFKETIAKNPKLLTLAENLFKKKIQEYGEALLKWSSDYGLKDRGPEPKNPEEFHLFLKKNNLHTVYALLKHFDKNHGAINTTTEPELAQFYEDIALIKQCKISFYNAKSDMWHYDFEYEVLFDVSSLSGKDRAAVKFRRYEHASHNAAADLTGSLDTYYQSNNDILPPVIGAFGEENIDSRIMLCRSDKTRQELLLLRTVPETQIPQTIDYFSKHLSYLTNQDNKLYFEANLFQPGLLREQLLTNNESFFFQFNKFISHGLEIFKDKSSATKECIFFVRMSFLVCQYAARLNSEKYLEKLDLLYKEINVLINNCKDETVKTALLKYRVMTANEIKVYSPERAKEFFIDDLDVLFSTNLVENYNENLDLENEYQYKGVKQKFVDSLEGKTNEEIIAALREIANRHRIDLNDCQEVYGNYPIFTFKIKGDSLQFDVKKGIIYKNGLANSVTPEELKKHPLLVNFGISEPYYFCSIGEKPIKTIKNEFLEIKIDKDRYFIRGLEGLKDGIWYEVFATDNNEAQQFGIKNYNNFISLSKTIADHGSFILLECGNVRGDLAIVKDNKVVMNGKQRDNGEFIITDIASGRVLCKNETSQLTRPFAPFESEQYIDVFYDNTDRIYHVELPRYGLSFSKGPDDLELHCQYNGEEYRLKTSESSLIEDGVPQLELVNAKGEEIAIFPICQFKLDEGRSRNSAYKNLKLDVFDSIDDRGIIASNKSWQRSGSKRCYALKITDGEPTPENSEEALYLAYLYLGSHRPDKAWQMLDLCDKKFGGITGAFAEVKYLQWIIENLSIADKKIESTPEVVSCQLKALSFLARIDPNRIVAGVKIAKPKTKNEELINTQTAAVSRFVESSVTHITTLYERLLDFSEANELVVQYSLTYDEKWMLLSYYNNKIELAKKNPDPVELQKLLKPRVSLEYQKLFTELLTHELDNLSKIENASTKITSRKILLKSYIDKVQPILFNAKAIGDAKVVFYVAPGVKLKPTEFKVAFHDRAKYVLQDELYDNYQLRDNLFISPVVSDGIQLEAMDALNDDLTPEQILKYFSLYVTIAESKDSSNFLQVKNFSERVLLAYAKASESVVANSCVYLLANVLYRICQNDNKDFLRKAIIKRESKINDWETANRHHYYYGNDGEFNTVYFEQDKKEVTKKNVSRCINRDSKWFICRTNRYENHYCRDAY